MRNEEERADRCNCIDCTPCVHGPERDPTLISPYGVSRTGDDLPRRRHCKACLKVARENGEHIWGEE